MTVHGAKGLEASVVFLVDTTTSPTDTQRLRLIQIPNHTAPDAPDVVVWAGKKSDDPATVAAARVAMLADTEDEYRRLLYVAMTRAADRLIIGGCMPGNMNSIRKCCWYDLIAKGLERSGMPVQQLETPAGMVKRYTRPEDATAPAGAAVASPAAKAPIALPSWLRAEAAPESSIGNLLRPSDPVDNVAHRLRRGEAALLRARALQRGTLVHRLLQSLPELAPERRRDAAIGYLARNADGWTEDDRTALAQSVLGLLDDRRFGPVFAPGSRAEVSIVGRLERPGRAKALVSGQIDRLVVTPGEILIVDYKTNHAPPRQAAEAPSGYVRQLALYRAVLARLYPERSVRAALLWTEAPDLMEISAPALDAQLAAIFAGDERA
jgi:ATP-dependent helicase/nuclease subunit A